MSTKFVYKNGFGEVLKIQAFRSLWFGQVFSQTATNSILFVLGLWIYQITGSNAVVSGLFLAYGLPALIFGLPAGAIVDKLDKRSVLIVCDVSRAVLTCLLVLFSAHVPFLYLYTMLTSIITQFYVPAEAPTIPVIVKPEQIVTANSLFSFTYFSSLALGSIFAGPLIRFFGPTGVLLFLAGLFALAAWQEIQLPKVTQGKALLWTKYVSPAYLLNRLWANLVEGWRYVNQVPDLKDALTLLAGTQVILAILGVLGPGFADRVLNIDVRDASLFITGPTVLGIILGAVWIGNLDRPISPKRLISFGVSAAGIILLVISVLVRLKRAPSINSWGDGLLLPILLILFFALGVANSLLDVPANSILQEKARGELRSRVYGILTAVVGGAGILPVVAGGVLADVIGPGKVVFLLGSVVFLYALWRVRYTGLSDKH